jgi:N-methylhydantoinase B
MTEALTAELDAITFEVIRHRLWAINDDQARMAARLSGSPIIFEGYDFNAALVTADGRSLYTGVYILHHGATIDEFVRHVLDDWAPEDIHEGDMFFTNDPWQGALHANDGILVMPIFSDGELVGWSGIVTHDMDVGSPAPGSFVTGAKDRFGEAPLFPGIRIAHGFELLADVERAYLRNSRTPENNALNMRARVAALRMTHERIQELIAQYGKAALLAAQEGILAYVERVVRARLRKIPDGSWSARGYLDHDGNTDAIYPVCCRVSKQQDRLVFDMTGTAPQAIGAINCARPAMEGALLGVLMISLCYDLPWAIGALRNVVEVVSEEGTLNNAVSPAAVSMASVMGALTTMDVASTAVAKMLMTSEDFHSEAQANWAPGIHGGMFIAPGPDGRPAVAAITDPFGGGGGARTFADGVDSGGIPHSMASRVANVEVAESRAPMLQVYRREIPDSGGPGRFRGGVSIEFGGVPHKAPAFALFQTLASGVSVPAGRGLSGGFPGIAPSSTILRGSDVRESFAAGRVPTSADELSYERADTQEAKQFSGLAAGDFVVGVAAGGAGYGDPLRRQPQAVARDVRDGLVSAELALAVYGVHLTDDGVDEERTAQERDRIRRSRLDAGRAATPAIDGDAQPLHQVNDTIEAVRVDGEAVLRCTVCGYRLCGYHEDFAAAATLRELPISATMPGNRHCRSDYVIRQYSCPGCGTAVGTDVQRVGDEPLVESHFGSGH